MAEAREALIKLENAVRQYDKVVEILIILTTTDERGATLYDSLVAIEEHVAALNDARLNSLHNRLVQGHRSFIPQFQQVLQADHKAFVERLVKLANESAVGANEADIELKETLGLDASMGLWGPKGWHPSQ